VSIHQVIKERSYFIWEGEGRPHGRSLDHWLMAEAELRVERESKPSAARANRATSSAKPAAASPAKAAAKNGAKAAVKGATAKPASGPAKKSAPRKA